MTNEKTPLHQIQLTNSMIYLILYNFVQALGWTALMMSAGCHWIIKDTYIGLYDETKMWLNIFQTLALLEVVHAAVGLVKSNLVLTGLQVASRIFITWGVTYSVKEVQDGASVAMFIGAWGITEIFRYTYYMCALVKQQPFLLEWCRYTFFIVLYPIGVTGELLTVFNALGYINKSGMYSVSLPNIANMSFSYYYLCIIAMIAYIPVFPQLYFHMFAQRKKILSPDYKKKV